MNDQIPEFSINSQIVCGTTQGCAMVFDDKLREYIKEKRISGYPMHDFVHYDICNSVWRSNI